MSGSRRLISSHASPCPSRPSRPGRVSLQRRPLDRRLEANAACAETIYQDGGGTRLRTAAFSRGRTCACWLGYPKAWPTFSPASSGSVHSFTMASRAEFACSVHMPGRASIVQASSTARVLLDLPEPPMPDSPTLTLADWRRAERALLDQEARAAASRPSCPPPCPAWCALPPGHAYDSYDPRYRDHEVASIVHFRQHLSTADPAAAYVEQSESSHEGEGALEPPAVFYDAPRTERGADAARPGSSPRRCCPPPTCSTR